MKIEVEYKLAGYGKHMGKDAAKIEGNYKKGQPIVNGKPLIFWVDLADGKTLHATGTFRADIQGKSLDTDFELKQL